MTCGISTDFSVLSPTKGQVAHVLLTRLPLGTHLPCGRRALARLACVRHAASVNPEPGSNSPSKNGDPGPSPESFDSTESFPLFSCQGTAWPPPPHPGWDRDYPAWGRTDRFPSPSPYLGRVDSWVGGVTAIVAPLGIPCKCGIYRPGPRSKPWTSLDLIPFREPFETAPRGVLRPAPEGPAAAHECELYILRELRARTRPRTGQKVRRPLIARARVSSSAYSRSPPTGSPWAGLVTFTPSAASARPT
jgi:hypothetical protein